MNRLLVAGGTALLLSVAVIACGGGGGGGTAPNISVGGGGGGGGGGTTVVPNNPAPAATATGGLATLSLTIPNATSGSAVRRTKYISSATQSVAVFAYLASATPPPTATTLVNVGPGLPGCTAVTAGTTCTITVPAQYGSMTFVVKTYDGVLGSGNLLSQATITQTIAPNQAAIPVTLSGIVAATQISVPAFSFPAGGGTFTVTVNALDPNGAVIVGGGTYSTPIALTSNDANVTFSPTLVTGPGQTVTVTYGATTGSGITLRARANGLAENAQAAVNISISQPAASNLTAFLYDFDRGFVFAMDAGANGLPGYQSRYTFPSQSYNAQLATNGTYLTTFTPYSTTIGLYGLHTGSVSTLTSPDAPYGAQAIAFDTSTASATSGDLAVLTQYAGTVNGPNVTWVAPNSVGTPAPVRTIISSALANASNIGIDGAGNLYALVPYVSPEVLVFPPGSSTPTIVPIALASGQYLNARLAVAADGTFAVNVFTATSSSYTNTINIYGPSGSWALARTIGGGPVGASFGGAFAFAPDDSLYYASGSGVAVYAPTATGTPVPIRGFLTTLENVQSIDAIALGAPLSSSTPAAASLTGDMLALTPNRTWNYLIIPQSGPRGTLTLYVDPNPVDGATGLVAFVRPTTAPDALPANGGTLAAAVGITSASDGYHAQSYGSVSNDSFGLIPGSPLLVPPTLVGGGSFITYPGVTAEVRGINTAPPGSSACPSPTTAVGAVVYYTFGSTTEQIIYVPGCGITRFVSDAGTTFVLQSIASHPEVGQQSVTRRVLHATYGDTLRSIWQQLLVRH